jgi:uncharacterized beta-barrel protein YwiB (DUF1934 family)
MTSRIGGDEPTELSGRGEYKQRGQRGRLTYALESDSGINEAEILDLEWNKEGRLVRLLRHGSGIRMEFIEGQKTNGYLTTPAGICEVRMETQKLEGFSQPGGVHLHLRYHLSVAGESQGIAELTVFTDESTKNQ